MNKSVDIFAKLKYDIPFFVGLCLCFYFSYHTVFGRYSYPQLVSVRATVTTRADELDYLQKNAHVLEQKVTLMRPATLSSDFLEEQIRYILGYNRNDEIVILRR